MRVREQPDSSAAAALGEIREAALASRRLILYRGVLQADPAVQALTRLVRAIANPAPTHPDRLWRQAVELAWCLAPQGPDGEGHEHAESPTHEPDGPAGRPDDAGAAASEAAGAAPWCCRLVEAMVGDENPFTQACSRAAGAGGGFLPPGLRETAAHDLRQLQRLARLTIRGLAEALAARGVDWPAAAWRLEGWVVRPGALPAGRWRASTPQPVRPQARRLLQLCERLQALADWGEAVPELLAYHREVGAGPMARFVAFCWQPAGQASELSVRGRKRAAGRAPGAGRTGGQLVGVARPDPVRLEDLVGYEEARGQVIANTERFVSGLPAHHLLLYGPRGTGKSATVKALVHAFADRGLRLVELPRDRLADLREVLRQLEGYPQRFILFVDDLSLAPGDPELALLKAELEGTVKPWPAHVRVYATSNRRHLVAAGPSDGEDPARPMDALHERLALADRFGLTVIFPSPDQELYLRIVEGVALQAGIRAVDGPPEAQGEVRDGEFLIHRASLRQQALRWAVWHNERSARSAVQFVEDLVARLAREREPAWAGRSRTAFPAIDGRNLPAQD